MPCAARRRPRLAGLLLALAVLFALAPGVARAEPTEEFKEHLERGTHFYQAKQYAAAIDEFRAAYAITPVANLLFNLGQAHLKIGRCEEALGFYEQYEKAETHFSVEDLRMLEESRKLALACRAPPAQAPASPAPEPPPQAAQAPVVAAPVITRAPAPTSRPRPIYKKWWFWTALGGAAVVGVVVGAALAPRSPPDPTQGIPAGNLRMVQF